MPGQPVGGWGAGVTTLPRGKLDEIPFQPWARAVYDMRQIDQFEPHTRCKASGVSRQFSTPYGTEFVEVPDLQRMYIMDNGGPNSYRIIYLDGRSFPENIAADQLRLFDRPLGGRHAGGRDPRPEREVLDRPRGTPHTAQLKFIERLTRTDMNTLRYQATIDDPGAYTGPWTTNDFSLRWRPGDELFEYICQQFNQGPELMLGSQEDVDNTRFFVP